MNVETFALNFQNHTLPNAFQLLCKIDEVLGFENYAEGFGLLTYDASLIHSWSGNNDPAFTKQLMPFAQANCSGSFYAVWDNGEGKELTEMPIVVFGDEGGVHIVANNIAELRYLLTFDVEISVGWDEAYFYKSETDDNTSDEHE